MRETTVLCEVVCGAEPAEAPNGADFALRRDDELCAHDGESRIGVFDASESDGRTRHEVAMSHEAAHPAFQKCAFM